MINPILQLFNFHNVVFLILQNFPPIPVAFSCYPTFCSKRYYVHSEKRSETFSQQRDFSSGPRVCIIPLNGVNRIKSATYGQARCDHVVCNCSSRFRPTLISVTSIKTRRTWRQFYCTGTRMGKCSL